MKNKKDKEKLQEFLIKKMREEGKEKKKKNRSMQKWWKKVKNTFS